MGILASFICAYIVKFLVQFSSSMIIVRNSNYISVIIFLDFVTSPHFNKMCEVTKGAWSSDIAKEKFDTNLKVHCVM